jgi:hypothetical protein
LKEKLVINGKGDEILILPQEGTRFTNKKIPLIDEERMLHHLADAQEIYEQQEVGQREASVELHPAHPDLPVYVWLNTDDHLGSIHTDYKAFLRDYTRCRELPNFYVINNGDEVDNFMVTTGKAAAGVYENPLNPQEQGFLFKKLFKQLDDQGKVIAFSFGNHNQWLRSAGYKFENTWLRDFKCPVLNCGGEVKLKVGEQEYKIGISHMHWGTSKINITNAGKRMMEHELPDSDIIFLGHTHQKSVEHLNRGGKDRLIVVGGTYKVNDEFGAEHGMGGRGSEGGVTLALWPDKRRMIAYYSMEEAVDAFETQLEVKKLHARKKN